LDQVFGKACSDEDEYNALLHALINLEEFANKDARANSMMIDSSRNLLQHPHTEKDPKAKAFIRWTLGKALLRERGEADEQAIAVLEEAAQDLGPGEHPALFAQIQMDLGTYFANRATSDRESNQTRALISYRSALDALTPEHDAKQFAGISVNMGLLLMDYVGGNRFANIEAAVKRFETALKACNETTDAETYASIQGGLGIAYFKRLIGSRRDNLATAITHYEEALRVRRTLMDPQSCIGILTNLALAYRSRSRFEPHRTEDLEKAIDCLHTALSLADRDEDPRTYALVEVNLAGAYAELPDTHPFEPTKLAPATYRNALSRLDPDVHADEYAGTSRSLAAYYFKRRSWEEAASAYARALSAVERLYSLHFFRTGRAHVLRSVTGFYDEMAYVLAQLGRVEEALEIAERGKTRFVREQTRLRALRPEGVPDDVWEKYSFAAYSLRNLEWEEIHLPGSPEGKPQWFQRATQELEDAVAAVQVYAPSFCQERSVPALLSSVLPERSAAVIVCVTELGGIAFALQEGGPPLVIDLPAFTSSFLQQLLFGEPSADDKYVTRGWIGSYARHSTDGHPRLEKWLNEFDRLLVKVGEHFCGPLSAALPPEITDLVLVVPGALSLLPLHAAPLAVQDAATLWEKYNVSYAPSLTILAACHERWPRSHDSTLYASIDPRVDATLPFAALEGDLIRHHFPQTTVHARSEATREHAARGISSAAITHFACHAEFDWRSPRTSGLQLADGTLTVDELLLGEVNVGTVRLMEGEGPGQEGYLVTMIQPRSAVLVILSACETALIDFMEGNPDEFIGVPTGFLLSGIPCVVSSLWSVADVSTALLMNRFHALVAAGASVAAALRDASFWLRDATASELAIILAKERDRLAVENSPLYPEASFAWRRMLGCPRDSRPFAEPFYHAAFVAGGIAWRPVLPNEKRPHATAPAS
jgi:CHAT domain-containing protein/tetratricopeptide (TPR) repeat protein